MFNTKQIVFSVIVAAGLLFASRLVTNSYASPSKPSVTSAQSLEWQNVSARGMNGLTTTYRAKVPGGWLVTNIFKGHRTGTGMTFVPDADHSWMVFGQEVIGQPAIDHPAIRQAPTSTKFGPGEIESSWSPQIKKPRYSPGLHKPGLHKGIPAEDSKKAEDFSRNSPEE